MAAAAAGGDFGCSPNRHYHRHHHFFFADLSHPPPQFSFLLGPLFRITVNTNEYALSSSSSRNCAALVLPLSSSIHRPPMAAKSSGTSTLEEEEQVSRVRIERLWQQYFFDPSQWWDKRLDKGNPEAPDFEHKTSKKALWIDERFSPSWLQAKLATLTRQAPQQSSSSSSSSSSLSAFQMAYGQESRTKELWEEFFLDSSQWWDNRSDKRNPRIPDFKHKNKKKALWIHNKFNPPWVHARLAAMGECQEQGQSLTPDISARLVKMEQLWQEFFSDPSQWWDNRFIKKISKYPDYKHKSTHEGLWIESWQNPPWVKAKMTALTLGQTESGDGLRSRVTGVFGNGDIVSKLCQEGRLKEALHMVEFMVQQNFQAPNDAYVSILKACSRRKALVEGKQVHALIVQSGRDSDVFLGSTLVDMYAKCGSVLDAHKVFNMMPEHTVFSWTALMSAYADDGKGEEVIDLFQQMQQTGIAPDKVSFVVVVKACGRIAALDQGKQLHSHIIQSGFESDEVVGSALIGMYAKCGCLEDACTVFNKMNARDVVSWNAMITGYAQQGLDKEALALYEQMKQKGVQPDNITYVVLLKACGRIAALEQGEQLHSHIIRSGFESDVIVGTAVVDMYAKCGRIELARQVFNRMHHERNVLSWNAMIAGYAQQRLGKEALALYEQMIQEGVQANDATFVALLKACASIAALEQGQQLHSHINESGFGLDMIVGSALIDMYAKCGSINLARQVFNKMSERDVVCWSVMIAAYAQQGLGKEALGLYEQMKQLDVQPDHVMYVVLLNACASIAALEQGKQLHSDIIRSGFEMDVIVGNTLIDMYAKCGCIEDAHKVFIKMNERDVVSWTAMISGYAQEGLGKEALTLWEQMQREGMKPNEITYVSILSACSHSGLVDEGSHLFDSMFKDHGVTPTMDHYACMVDLLGRAGCLADAENFIEKMPIEPDTVVWMALLGAARNRGHVEIGRRAFDCIVKLEPDNASAYVLLSNIYAEAGRSDELAKIRREMKDVGEENAWLHLN